MILPTGDIPNPARSSESLESLTKRQRVSMEMLVHEMEGKEELPLSTTECKTALRELEVGCQEAVSEVSQQREEVIAPQTSAVFPEIEHTLPEPRMHLSFTRFSLQ